MRSHIARFVKSAFKTSDLPADKLPEIAFIGRSNVGKSSVINSLLKVRDLARTSSTPGKTRAINFYLIDNAFYFVDLPGYGYAKVPKVIKTRWQSLVEAYLSQRENLLLSVLIVDARHGLTEHDEQMRRWLEYYQIPYVVVATKADKIKRSQLSKVTAQLEAQLQSQKPILYSAVIGMGSLELWRQIQARLEAAVRPQA